MQREIDNHFPAFFQCDPDCYVTVAGLYISIVVGIRAAARHRKMDLDRDSLHKYGKHHVVGKRCLVVIPYFTSCLETHHVMPH